MGTYRPDRISVDLTFTTPAATVTAGDLLADVQALALPSGIGGGPVNLMTMHIRDEDDNTIPVDLAVVFARASTSLGTEDQAFAPSDLLARDITYNHFIDSSEWLDIGGSKIYSASNLNILLPTDGSNPANVYVGLWLPTTQWVATATGIKATFGFTL